MDDAGVYRLDDETAIIQTVDFFTPVVDDPYTYGAISAANSLSDVYAMGGRPITALNAGAKAGDVLYLTKPLGTGVITTALKNGKCPPEVLEGAVEVMLILNALSAEAMVEAGATACTDISGFGLGGHAHQLAHSSGVALEIEVELLPILPGAVEAIEEGNVPGGLRANRDFIEEWLALDNDSVAVPDIFSDPQTSGGLLISIAGSDSSRLEGALTARGVPVHRVGRVVDGRAGELRLV